MEYTGQALLLMKKYAVKCNIDWNNLGATLFQPRLEAKARSMGSEKITTSIVRWYWLEDHNSVLQKLFDSGKIKKQEMEYCKVSVKKGRVFHQNMFIETRKGS